MRHKIYYHRRVICEIEIDDRSVLGLLMRGKFAPAWAELTRRMDPEKSSGRREKRKKDSEDGNTRDVHNLQR